MANHAAVAALPVSGAGNKALLRAAMFGRTAYVIFTAAEAQSLVAVDPDAGTVIPALILNGRIYWYEAADATTAHDGVTCLVSSEGKRYLLDALSAPISVLDKDLTEPPADPAIGDTYLLFGAPSGDWADGAADQIAIFTSRGWEYVTPNVGQLVYVEDEDGFYRFNASGNWVAGFGVNALPSNSIKASQLIGSVGWLHPIVENQTTTAPPTGPTPSKGAAYIIGPSATGGWAGHDGKVAVYEDDAGGYAIYTPQEGWRVYDKAQDADYVFNGTEWISQRGAIINYAYAFTEGTGSQSTGGSGNYSFSTSTPPTTSQGYRQDDVTLTYAARRSGAILRFKYQYIGGAPNNSGLPALFVDSVSNAIGWSGASVDSAVNIRTFIVVVADTSPHVYKMRLVNIAGGPATISMRLFEVEEFA